MFTRPSHNLAAPNDATAGGHEETARASFAREKKGGAAGQTHSLSTPVADKKKPFYFLFPHPTELLRLYSHPGVTFMGEYGERKAE